MQHHAVAGVGFDIDHTIAVDNKLERVAFMRILEMVVDDGGHALGTLGEETSRIDALLQHQRSGACSIDDAVREFVRERGVVPRDFYVERFRALAVAMVDEFVIPLPGAKRTFAALRERGIRMAVLSNGWNPLQIRKAERAGFEGPVLASADLGVQKPAARCFEGLLGALEVPPGNAWYVGDDPWADVEGARAAGLHAVWFDADNQTYPPELLPPEYTICSLEELPEVLSAPFVDRGAARLR
ncbi:MAG: HAD family hydrolase [Candidatus Tumulicola sp.]